MSTDPSQTELQLRLAVCASDGHDVHHAVRQLMDDVRSANVLNMAQSANVLPEALQQFAKTFGQGMQWVHEQYPHVDGAAAVVFGLNGPIRYKGLMANPRTLSLARPPDGIGECFIAARLAFVHECMQHWHGGTVEYGDKKGQSLGRVTTEEAVFLAGVEEAYHAVQNQDSKMSEHYRQQDLQELLSPITIGTHTTELDRHDLMAREIDVGPVVEKALNEFRERKARQPDGRT